MIRYLLDTDTSSYIMRRFSPQLMRRFNQLSSDDWAISAITCGEILFGLERVPAFHPARIRFDEFARGANILDWPVAATGHYANIRHANRAQPLHDRDIFIAAHAIALEATLVTNNTRHFSRMGNGLRLENWLD
jgi:tRNA(fMet)-specific endonuclease VapC